MRSPVGHKRQRNPRHRHEPDIHPDIDDDMAHEKYRDAERKQDFKIGGPKCSVGDDAPHHDPKTQDKDHGPDQSPFLGKGGENEVRFI